MEQSLFQMLTMLAGGEWPAVLALFAIALFYFLAPILHYSGSNRFWIVASLWTLVIRFGLGFCRVAWISLEQWDAVSPFANQGPGFGGRGVGQQSVMNTMILIGFPPLEAGLFVLSLFLFVYWLTGLRRRELPPPD
jgi:hypothetical protein